MANNVIATFDSLSILIFRPLGMEFRLEEI